MLPTVASGDEMMLVPNPAFPSNKDDPEFDPYGILGTQQRTLRCLVSVSR
jgi:hypothetical protein